MSAELRRDRAALVGLALVSVLFQLPFLNRGISRLDEGSILAIADALGRGEVLYRDRATFIGPMIYEGMHLLGSLFGTQLWVGRVFQALVFSACTLLVYRILREFASSAWALGAALAFLAVKPLAFPLWTIPNYSQWATLEALVALLAGLRFLATRRHAWLALAGFAVGLLGVTKQTGAGTVGVALAATVALDALLKRDDSWAARLTAIAKRAGLLAAAALPPIAFFASYYAVQGALPDAIDRAVLGLLSYSGALGVPLPGFEVWSMDPAVLGPRSFVYFPTAVLSLAWQGGLNLYSSGLALLVEHAVKFCYYAPLLAMMAACYALRGLSLPSPTAALRLLYLLLFAALAYWSASFRADWTHLMSIMPEMIVLCVAVLHHFGGASRWGRGLAISLAGAWLLGGGLVAAAVFRAYDTPLETSRGRLLVTPDEASGAEPVLRYAAAQPSDQLIAFLPNQPLFYSLSDRPILSAFDLLSPAYFRPGDDASLAADLAEADQIVYDPNAMPTIAAPLGDFAPASAAVLARSFEFSRALSKTAYLLERFEPGRESSMLSPTVLDLFDWEAELPKKQKSRRVENQHWMMYRVLAATIRSRDAGNCISVPHRVGPGESLVFVPMFHPRLWTGEEDASQLRRARISVRVQEQGVPARTLFSELREAGAVNRPVELSLQSFVGEIVGLTLCATRQLTDPGLPGMVGFAEARVVRRSSGDS